MVLHAGENPAIKLLPELWQEGTWVFEFRLTKIRLTTDEHRR